MGIIYTATNIVNGKQYVGQTTYTIQKRAKEHFNDMERGRDCKFYRAIKKYGFENFIFSELEIVPDAQLNARESYWINVLDTYANGYNSTFGGDGSMCANKDAIRELWDNGASLSDISDDLGYCKVTIGSTLKNYTNYDSSESKKRGKRNQMHSVTQYDLYGNFIQTFDSIADAARHYHIDKSLISACCRKKRWSGVGYQWRYSDDCPPGNYLFERKCGIPIEQYSLDGKFICLYESLSSASKTTGICRDSIAKCIYGKMESAGGYIWKQIYRGEDV